MSSSVAFSLNSAKRDSKVFIIRIILEILVGSGLECGFSLLTDGINGFRRILGTIHGGTCDQYVGTGLGYNVRGLRADTAMETHTLMRTPKNSCA